MTVAISRRDMDAASLRTEAARCQDRAVARRILAIALVLEGSNRADAARGGGMDRQTLRDWVHRYNELGLEGLKNRQNHGHPPHKLTVEQEAALADWVRKGPDPERHKVTRWRLVDLRDEISRCFGVEMNERSVGKVLVRLKASLPPVHRRPMESVLARDDATISEAGSECAPPASRVPSMYEIS